MKTTLAEAITKAASTQTYYTIRFLVDPERVADAYRAYAYFRWVDDTLDAESASVSERCEFVQREKSLLESLYRGGCIADTSPHEQMLVELVRTDTDHNSGLHSYLFNMMSVMEFDVERRGRLITQNELNEYTRWLAIAVTEALHYFIGHDCPTPRDHTRIQAVSAAHIAHMLRDTYDDVQAGYFNVPIEVLKANHMTPQDVQSGSYRNWVKSRVKLAKEYFKAGCNYFSRVGSARCKLAGLAYCARFTWLLDTIEREGFLLRPAYDERKSFVTGVGVAISTLSSMLIPRIRKATEQPISVQERKP